MVEYLRVLVVGPIVPKVAMVFVYAITALLLGGLFYLIFNGIGVSASFWKIWSNMRKEPVDEGGKGGDGADGKGMEGEGAGGTSEDDKKKKKSPVCWFCVRFAEFLGFCI